MKAGPTVPSIHHHFCCYICQRCVCNSPAWKTGLSMAISMISCCVSHIWTRPALGCPFELTGLRSIASELVSVSHRCLTWSLAGTEPAIQSIRNSELTVVKLQSSYRSCYPCLLRLLHFGTVRIHLFSMFELAVKLLHQCILWQQSRILALVVLPSRS